MRCSIECADRNHGPFLRNILTIAFATTITLIPQCGDGVDIETAPRADNLVFP